MKRFKILFSVFLALTVLFIGIGVKATTETTLLPGAQFNSRIRELLTCTPEIHSGFGGTNQECSYVTGFVRENSIPANVETVLLSTEDDPYSVRAWRSNDELVHWNSNADTIYMNSDSSLMFSWFTRLESLDLRDFNTSKVTNMQEMFAACFKLSYIDMSNFNTSKVTNMMGMFISCTSLQSVNLSTFDTRKVTNFTYMFDSCDLRTIDLSYFDTRSSNGDLSNMFYYNRNLETIKVTKLFTLNSGYTIFYYDDSIVGGQGTHFDYDDASFAHIDGGVYNPGYFTEVDTKKVYIHNTVAGTSTMVEVVPNGYVDEPASSTMFGYELKGYYTTPEHTTKFDFDNTRINSETHIYTWYEPKETRLIAGRSLNKMIRNLTYEPNGSGPYYPDNQLNTTIIKIKKSSTIDEIYKTDSHLISEANLPKAYAWFDNGTIYWWSEVDKVYLNSDSMGAFRNLSKLTEIDTEDFDTSQVTSMQSMFQNDSSLTELNMSSWDTSNVTNTIYMFKGCSNIEELDVTKFDTSNLRMGVGMFSDMTKLKSIDVTHFDTRKLIDSGEMFKNCSSLTELDLTSWDTSNLELYDYAGQIFYGCSNLERIYATDKLVLRSVNDSEDADMFYGCEKLEGILGTKYSADKIDRTYAHIDGGESNPGYFTEKVYVKVTYMSGSTKFHEEDLIKHSKFVLADKPTKENFIFINWYYDENFENVYSEDDRFSENKTLYAKFEELPIVTITNENNQGTVTVTGNNNQVNSGDHVPKGTNITVEVTPTANYEFVKVEIKDKEGNVVRTFTDNSFSYEVNENTEIVTTYSEKPIVTITNNDSEGTVTVTENNNQVNSGDHVATGTNITVEVTPTANYEFVKVEIKNKEGNVVRTFNENSFSYEVNENIEIVTTYSEKPIVTISNENSKGTVTITENNNPVNSGDHVATGTKVKVEVTPTEAYKVKAVEIKDDDGNVLETKNNEPFEYEVNENIVVAPTYEALPEINIPDNPDGKVEVTTPNGDPIGKYVEKGTPVVIDVTPVDGKKVAKVVITNPDGTKTEILGEDLPYSYIVTGPITIEPEYIFDYKIIEGDNQTYTKGTNKDIVIKCNGVLEDFNGIEIDNGNPVDPSNYEVVSGSTILTLKASFLEESSLGEHTITFNYKDGGSAEAKLTIEEEVVVPITGDSIISYLIVLISSIITLSTTVIYKKKLSN